MNLLKNYVSNKPDYTTFGGRVYEYDYEGYNSMVDVASRIASDWKFDEKCKKLVEKKNRKDDNK